eukprot:s57_g45.t1
MEDVRAEAAVAVASTLVDKVHQERKTNAAKIVKYPPPPPFIRAVLLVQALRCPRFKGVPGFPVPQGSVVRLFGDGSAPDILKMG